MIPKAFKCSSFSYYRGDDNKHAINYLDTRTKLPEASF